MEPKTMTTTEPRPVRPRVSEVPVPADARRLSTLRRIDYADAFTVTASGAGSAEQWVHAVLQEAPRRIRRRLVIGWSALGLRLAPPWSANRVPGFVLLAADSWFGFRGELLFRSEADHLLFATFVQQTNPAGRALWAMITPRHRRVVGSLLTRAARRAGELPGPSSAVGGYDRGSGGAAGA